MKQFFIILFGGLATIIIGILLISGLMSLLGYFGNFANKVKQPKDGTSISGVKRIIRYTASEEENLLHAATESLPRTSEDHITAKGYIVQNLTLGGIVIENDLDTIKPIASITKLITAVVARRLIDPDERVTITKEIMDTYGNTAQFKTGETLLAKDLYYPLLMVSSNDAAEALARDYGRKKFIDAMNDFVQSIGAYRTYFTDPSGLSENNVSTPRDLAIILDWIRKNDREVIDITSFKAKTIKSHTWVNPTHFLNWSTYAGGKNGYTPEADMTSASLFVLGPNKNIYAIVLLGSISRDADLLKLLEKIR
ncbi:MAG: serine hydrolase [Candidatus Paceibacterota bacterium]|jgi:D-alanyl-D-alanine endopeptidase (penicillin-binding protein 7)